MPTTYDTAKICVNGHIITDSVQYDAHSQQNFCDKCGEELITNCIDCNAPIRGIKRIPDYLAGSRPISLHEPKPFCYNCGKPYPWTITKLDTAKELAKEFEGITEDDKEILVKSLDGIIVDTPRTQLEASRYKRIISKVGTRSASILHDLIVDIVSETAKKVIWG